MVTKIGAHEAKTHLADFLNRASYSGERIVVERHGKPIAALVSMTDLHRLERADDAAAPERKERADEAGFRSDMEAAGIMIWPEGKAAVSDERIRVHVDGSPVSEQIVAERR